MERTRFYYTLSLANRHCRLFASQLTSLSALKMHKNEPRSFIYFLAVSNVTLVIFPVQSYLESSRTVYPTNNSFALRDLNFDVVMKLCHKFDNRVLLTFWCTSMVAVRNVLVGTV